MHRMRVKGFGGFVFREYLFCYACFVPGTVLFVNKKCQKRDKMTLIERQSWFWVTDMLRNRDFLGKFAAK